MIALLRLTKLPFGIMNYLLGCLTSVSLWHYALGTTTILFKTSVFTFLGAALFRLTTESAAPKGINWPMILEVSVLGITMTLTLYLSYKALVTIEEQMEQRRKIRE